MTFKALIPADGPLHIPTIAAAVVTAAVFGKLFVPFYLIGSTAIFVVLCAIGIALVALSWRSIEENARHVNDALAIVGLLYSLVMLSYLVRSAQSVPITHLLGILIFHALFLMFGFAAARAPLAVFVTLLAQAAVYLIYVLNYVARVGDVMRNGILQNLFGIEDENLSIALHSHIAGALGLALLAILGFGSRSTKRLAFAALPLVLFLILHLSARTTLVALSCALIFLAWAELWVISRKWALASLAALVVMATIASILFYRYAVNDSNISSSSRNIVTRTIKEIQSNKSGYRLPIWSRTWHRLTTDPFDLPLGRGVGAFPIDEGAGAPDWLLRKTEAAKHFPHNVHLEVLYEGGVFALLAFSLLTLFPLVYALKYWAGFEAAEKAAISLYVFYLVSVEISGSFAYGYDFQFFLALAIGIISIKRRELAEAKV